MAKSYAGFYQPDKRPPTTKFYNQKYSGAMYGEFDYDAETQETRKDKRSDSYDRYKTSDKRVTKRDLKQGPHDYIGAVSSSWLTSLGYNAAAGEAVATFKGSGAEFYYKMSYDTFLDWLSSPSKGRWLNDHPQIMHDYTMRGGGRGSQKMEDRIDQFHTKNTLKERGCKARMKKKLAAYMSKYG
jgi:hypothetical protein